MDDSNQPPEVPETAAEQEQPPEGPIGNSERLRRRLAGDEQPPEGPIGN